jgi:hypothetical protein
VDLRHLLPLIIFGGGFSLVGAVLYGAWMLGRYRGRDENAPADLQNLEARLYRVEQAALQITNSLDRLEAAHRMTARLLTEMPQGESKPRRSTTPH